MSLPGTTWPSRQRTSLRAPAAMSTSAMSISAIASRPVSCSPRSPRPNSITRSRSPRPRWSSPRLTAAAERSKPRAGPGHLGARQASRQARLGDPAAGRHRPHRRYQAQQHAVRRANRTPPRRRPTTGANQQKIYQQVVAPFDGVVTQRNIDVGSLVQADATSGTSMFS